MRNIEQFYVFSVIFNLFWNKIMDHQARLNCEKTWWKNEPFSRT